MSINGNEVGKSDGDDGWIGQKSHRSAPPNGEVANHEIGQLLFVRVGYLDAFVAFHLALGRRPVLDAHDLSHTHTHTNSEKTSESDCVGNPNQRHLAVTNSTKTRFSSVFEFGSWT